jgi:hypothetical protein
MMPLPPSKRLAPVCTKQRILTPLCIVLGDEERVASFGNLVCLGNSEPTFDRKAGVRLKTFCEGSVGDAGQRCDLLGCEGLGTFSECL